MVLRIQTSRQERHQQRRPFALQAQVNSGRSASHEMLSGKCPALFYRAAASLNWWGETFPSHEHCRCTPNGRTGVLLTRYFPDEVSSGNTYVIIFCRPCDNPVTQPARTRQFIDSGASLRLFHSNSQMHRHLHTHWRRAGELTVQQEIIPHGDVHLPVFRGAASTRVTRPAASNHRQTTISENQFISGLVWANQSA
jgi:hypothetical protein